MKQLKDFKKKIKEEPEMEIYEENTNKLIDKLKTFLTETYKKYGKKFLNGKLAKVTTIITSLTSIIPIATASNSPSPEIAIINEINNDDEYDCSFSEDEDENDYEEKNDDNNILDFGEEAAKIFENNIIFFAYMSVSFLHLGWSVIEFYKAYKELTKIKDDIK